MTKSRKLKRWIALLVLAAITFAQANLALAGCELERRALAHFAATAGPESGCDMPEMQRESLGTARCLAHCTADLQIAGLGSAIVRGAGESPGLTVAVPDHRLSRVPDRGAPPSAPVPIRILLHAFRV